MSDPLSATGIHNSVRTPPSFFFLWGWVQERFPPENLLVFGLASCCIGTIARGGISLSWVDFSLFLTITSFFLQIRIIDEHKDFAVDLENHPQRVLQSGKISLYQLRLVGYLSSILTFFTSLYFALRHINVGFWFLITYFWLGLMTKEFFLGRWLEKHLPIYALSHLMIMPLACLWWLALINTGIGNHSWVPFESPVPCILLIGFIFFGSAAGEITRKARGLDESHRLASYNAYFGVNGAAILSWTLTLFMLVCSMTIGITVIDLWERRILVMILPFSLFLMLSRSLSLYSKAPTERRRKKNEACYAGVLLSCYLAIILSYALR